MIKPFGDTYFMQQAIKEAQVAFEKDEVPVGAIAVCENRIIARAHNQTQLLNDVTAHAEMLSITAAAGSLGGKYLKKVTLYVTLEPCVMCAGALFWSQIDKVVIGALDEKRGFLRYGKDLLHPQTEIITGVLERDCQKLLTTFFQKKR